jgi:hypothetical protein
MRKVNKTGAALWTVQGLLAVLFLRFIGVAETLGALGLVLPGITRTRTELTSLAAAGLVVIMVGATVTTGAMGGVGAAAIPAVVGALCVVVAYKRSTITVERTALQPAS